MNVENLREKRLPTERVKVLFLKHIRLWAASLFCANNLVLPFLFVVFTANAQDTVSLKSVEINASKNKLWQTGQRAEAPDSLTRELFRNSSLADLLNFGSQVFIKSYGPGALATTAFRGGSAYHTAVLWNGFNLQNAMLGQTDLALLPALLFNQVEVEHGGSAALWGSGAVAGSIQLGNLNLFASGFKTTANFNVGSFGLKQAAVSLTQSSNKFVSSTKMYLTSNLNNYLFKDTLDSENQTKRLQHAAYSNIGIMQEFKFLLAKNKLLGLNAWINGASRELPATGLSSTSKSYQRDGALRLSGIYTVFGARSKTNFKGAFFNERINYGDSLRLVFSDSRVKTAFLEAERYHEGKRVQLNYGISATHNRAVADNYAGTAALSKVAALAGSKFLLAGEKLTAYTVLRIEHYNTGATPLTGNLALSASPLKNLELGVNVARLFRQPTLNELYWLPGGNPALKPEQGISYEGNLQVKKQIRAFRFSLAGSLYSRYINNWVLWTPGAGGSPTPQNVQTVWSRGSESSLKAIYTKKQFRLRFNFMSTYVLSTVEKSSLQNSEVQGRQLIYTPRYTFNSSVNAQHRFLFGGIYYNYAGYRFVSSDNSNWLPPYHLVSLRIGYKYAFVNSECTVYASCNNLLNSNYAVVVARPMPLRNYEAGFSIQAKRKSIGRKAATE